MIRLLILINLIIFFSDTMFAQNILEGYFTNSGNIPTEKNINIDWTINALHENFIIPIDQEEKIIHDQLYINEVRISPNPFSNNIIIETNKEETYVIVLYNSIGQVVINPKIINSDSQISTINLVNGIYYINIYDQSNRFLQSRKLIKL